MSTPSHIAGSLCLLSLPPELTEKISQKLDLQSAKHLRLTCKTLGEQLSDTVLNTFSFDVNRINFEQRVSQLADLSTGKYATSTSTKVLFIRSLSPVLDPNYVPSLWSDPPKEDPLEFIAAREGEMKKHLFDGLASFKAVQNVVWIAAYSLTQENKELQLLAYNALKTLPNLRRLHATLDPFQLPFDLESFGGLQEISLDNLYEPEPTLESLGKLIAKNTDITSLDIYNKSSKHPTLHQLFKYCSPHAPPSQLRHLGLGSFYMRLDEVTLPHFKNLTSLEITNIKDPSIKDPYAKYNRYNESELQVEQENERLYGSSYQDIWKMVHTSGIRLDEVTLDVIPPSFIDYISSYTGLKKLRICPEKFESHDLSNEMANRFFAEAFRIHMPTLEDLRITPQYEGQWCFRPCDSELLSQCTNLRRVRLGVLLSDLKEDIDGQPGNALQVVLDTVITFMPHIERVHLSGAESTDKDLPEVGCGVPSDPHFSEVDSLLEKHALAYRAPLSCDRLPMLKLTINGGSIFAGASPKTSGEASEEPLKYIDVTPPYGQIEYDF